MQYLRSVVPGVCLPAVPNALGCTLLALQFQLERTQWLPVEKLLQMQLAQLKAILDHASRTVPYYRELFRKHGLTVPDKLEREFLDSVPISRRAAVYDAGDTLRSEAFPSQHGDTYPIVTSGSTGQPVHMLGTGVTHLLWRAFGLREHLWHRRDLSKKLAVIRWAEKNSCKAPDGEHAPSWGYVVTPPFESGPSCMLNVATPLKQQIAWLLREQPEYLLSYPSNLDALARYCLEHRIEFPRIVEVRTVGETLNAAQRALYGRAWSCKVVDVYSCEEAGYLALQCPASHHFHVQSENVVLEIVDEEGRACPTGEVGRVLVTTLHNFATPLVRYEVGDYAAFGERCGCNRRLPVITKIHGRRRNRMIYPDGRSEFPYLGEHGQVYNMTGVRVRGFQFVQRSVEEIEVRVVAERKFTSEETTQLSQLYQRNFGHPFRITITYWNEIPKSKRGKFEEFVSEVDL